MRLGCKGTEKGQSSGPWAFQSCCAFIWNTLFQDTSTLTPESPSLSFKLYLLYTKKTTVKFSVNFKELQFYVTWKNPFFIEDRQVASVEKYLSYTYAEIMYEHQEESEQIDWMEYQDHGRNFQFYQRFSTGFR